MNCVKWRYRKMTGQKKMEHSESTQHWVDTKCPNSWKVEQKYSLKFINYLLGLTQDGMEATLYNEHHTSPWLCLLDTWFQSLVHIALQQVHSLLRHVFQLFCQTEVEHRDLYLYKTFWTAASSMMIGVYHLSRFWKIMWESSRIV